MTFNLQDHTHLLITAGSRCLGLHTNTSDVDLLGVCIPPLEVYFAVGSFKKPFEQCDRPSDVRCFRDLLTDGEAKAAAETKLEGTVYELRKLLHLAVSANPTIFTLLFCREQEIRVQTKVGKVLRDHRDLFLSVRCRGSFVGYANAQLKRIRRHRRWLLDPPSRQPLREDFNLPKATLTSKGHLQAAHAAVRKKLDQWEWDWADMDQSHIQWVREQIRTTLGEILASSDQRYTAAARSIGLDDNLIEVMQREREYEAARREWRSYQQWGKNRNPERAKLEAESGYDRKHAAHLVRLLRQGKEILENGEVNVWRGGIDAEELLAIRHRGIWTYEQINEWADDQVGYIHALVNEGRVHPKVHPKVDMEAVDQLSKKLIETALL